MHSSVLVYAALCHRNGPVFRLLISPTWLSRTEGKLFTHRAHQTDRRGPLHQITPRSRRDHCYLIKVITCREGGVSKRLSQVLHFPSPQKPRVPRCRHYHPDLPGLLNNAVHLFLFARYPVRSHA